METKRSKNSKDSPSYDLSELKSYLEKQLRKEERKKAPQKNGRLAEWKRHYLERSDLVRSKVEGEELKLWVYYPPTPWRAPNYVVKGKGNGGWGEKKIVGYRPSESQDALFVRAVVPALRLACKGGSIIPPSWYDGKGRLLPLQLKASFVVPRPQKVKGTSNIYPTTRPDLTNYTKLLEDCLVRGDIIPDDSVIVRHVTQKIYAEKGEEGKIIICLSPVRDRGDE
ncbi:MAG: RusA family crossover junction endodeoxyribonuclease [Candidatus Hadarchaeales archaeon]